MVDKAKVAVMTKAAREEKRNHRKADPAIRYFMYDYVLMQVIKGVIAVTFFYAAVAACYLLYTMEQWITQSTIDDLIHIFMRMGIIYGGVVLISVIFLSLIYSLRYMQAKKLVEKEERIYHHLMRFYNRRR